MKSVRLKSHLLLRIIINYNPVLPRLYNIVIIFIKVVTVHLRSLDFLTDVLSKIFPLND